MTTSSVADLHRPMDLLAIISAQTASARDAHAPIVKVSAFGVVWPSFATAV